jgi:hypothetical protein
VNTSYSFQKIKQKSGIPFLPSYIYIPASFNKIVQGSGSGIAGINNLTLLHNIQKFSYHALHCD